MDEIMEPVLIEQFFLGCLAHASYIVASEGVAAVIDPQRDVDLYLDFARENNLRIEHIIESHLHADFVSGHHELAERTGATIYLGVGSGATFPHRAVGDGGTIEFGQCRIEFLHTPGHTEGSVCLYFPAEKLLIAGDTLFARSIGRTDLPGGSFEKIMRSLHDRILTLPDDTVVIPGHGPRTTIGEEKEENPFLIR